MIVGLTVKDGNRAATVSLLLCALLSCINSDMDSLFLHLDTMQEGTLDAEATFMAEVG